MKSLYLFILLGTLFLTFLTSCLDTPRTRRATIKDDSTFESSTTIIYTDDNDDSSSDSPDTSTSTPSDATQCTSSNSSHLGGTYTICKTNDETRIYFKVQTSSTSGRVWIIPTTSFNINGQSSSTYIGEQRYINMQPEYQEITFSKNRVDSTGFSYSLYPITGVMIIREGYYDFTSPYRTDIPILAPEAYLLCMQFLSSAYPDTRYCNVFNSAGHFQYHQF